MGYKSLEPFWRLPPQTPAENWAIVWSKKYELRTAQWRGLQQDIALGLYCAFAFLQWKMDTGRP